MLFWPSGRNVLIISPTSIAPNVTLLLARVPIGENLHALPILSQLGNDTIKVHTYVVAQSSSNLATITSQLVR